MKNAMPTTDANSTLFSVEGACAAPGIAMVIVRSPATIFGAQPLGTE
jgi:hypothetical protein